MQVDWQVPPSGVRLRAASERSRQHRTGFTLVEALIVVIIVSVLLTMGATLLTAAGRAYDNIIWQPRVTQEAQQALDDICDTLRIAGLGKDMLGQLRSQTDYRQVDFPSAGSNGSTFNNLTFYNTEGHKVIYQRQQSSTTGTWYLTSQDYHPSPNAVAQFIVDTNFEYEYRNVVDVTKSTTDPNAWSFSRLGDLAIGNGTTTDPVYLIEVVYVTVTATYKPYADSPSYTRTLRSAVHLRAPYNTTVPPAGATP